MKSRSDDIKKKRESYKSIVPFSAVPIGQRKQAARQRLGIFAESSRFFVAAQRTGVIHFHA